MKERPILFSAPMVRATLEDRKTQTRRIIIDQPFGEFLGHVLDSTNKQWDGSFCWRLGIDDIIGGQYIHCPYGKPGDRLWVRETFMPLTRGYSYRADALQGSNGFPFGKWCPSIHMPRRASRILLEIASVRVEHLCDITGKDILCEGIDNGKSNPSMGMRWENMQRMAFQDLWETINGKGSWSQNPWVWVIEFRRIPNA